MICSRDWLSEPRSKSMITVAKHFGQMLDSQLPYITAGLQPAHNLLSHKYANHPQLPHAKICHNSSSSSCHTGVGREFPHIRHTLSHPLPSHSSIAHSIHSHPRKTRHRCAHARRRICRAPGFRGVVQLRRSRHLEGRVPDIAQGVGQDFPVPCLECVGPFRTWHGKVPGGILRDLGDASAWPTAMLQLSGVGEMQRGVGSNACVRVHNACAGRDRRLIDMGKEKEGGKFHWNWIILCAMPEGKKL